VIVNGINEFDGVLAELEGLRATVAESTSRLGEALTGLAREETRAEGGRPIMARLLGPQLTRLVQADPRSVLVLNPGSTSTKVALFRGLDKLKESEVHLSPDAPDGVDARAEGIAAWLQESGVDPEDLDGIACRGGFLAPVPTGTYRVVPEMLADLEHARIAHASNLAIPIGVRLAGARGLAQGPVLTTSDPVVSDEMELVERVTGYVKVKRDGSGAHYLNHKAVWRYLASLLGRAPDQVDAVTAHLGGGVSIAAHRHGQVTALVDAFSGIASANRAGMLDLPRTLALLDADQITLRDLKAVVFKQGGLLSLAGTNDFRALTSFRDQGASADQRRKIDVILDFYARQVAQSVLRLASDGRPVQAVVLTGGLARSDALVERITACLAGRFPLVRLPGSLEHESLAAGLMRAVFCPGELKDYVAERDALKRRRDEENRLLDTVVFQRKVRFHKPGAPILTLDDAVDAACQAVQQRSVPTVAIVGADNEEAIQAARRANAEGLYRLARFALVGDSAAINEMAYEYDLVIDDDNYSIVDTDDPVAEAVNLLDRGQAQILMKGKLKTEEVLRGVFQYLKRTGRLRPGEVISHVVVMDIPRRNKLLLITDAAVNPYPDEDKKLRILENALRVAACLNIGRPKVAVISAVETVNRSIESSLEAERIAARLKDRTDCVVEGPLSLDVAMDPAIATEKKYQGLIRGTADILLMPDIDAGNVLYKTLTTQSGATCAGVILCGDMPLVLTSRGDSARSKLASIALAVKLYNDVQEARP
jgi:phosphate butyryltransferase